MGIRTFTHFCYLSLLILNVFLPPLFAFMEMPAIGGPIPRFYKVTEGIYRGGRPGSEGLSELKNMNIKTIVNLENDERIIRFEAEHARRLGIRSYSYPLSVYERPSDTEIDKIHELMANKSNHPIFIHCKHGEDRTGLVIGLFKVFFMNMQPKDAYDEMLALGFHPQFEALDRYYKDRTAMKRRSGFQNQRL